MKTRGVQTLPRLLFLLLLLGFTDSIIFALLSAIMNILRLARMLASYVEARGVDGGVLSVAMKRGVFLQEGGGQVKQSHIRPAGHTVSGRGAILPVRSQ